MPLGKDGITLILRHVVYLSNGEIISELCRGELSEERISKYMCTANSVASSRGFCLGRATVLLSFSVKVGSSCSNLRSAFTAPPLAS